ncbi:hypothetical protein Clacol_001805 [Clathrus columnatus]|uniref:Uncharacterized protein n=1 Tax=Clathrus columnatus TaxID=1419009 RepID=A0AAV5A2D5_9AGAM|nr:hypothetical protein Clacol_001805 [Clathrus columnatus]
MSQLPDDTLRKILIQIQQTAVQSQRALTVTRSQITAKERERRILQLTIDEITGMKGDVKMFMAVPKPVMEKQLKVEERSLADELNALNKKVGVTLDSIKDDGCSYFIFQTKYLDKQFNDAQAQLKDIFHSSRER